ncbi:hypothetical protein HDU98_006117, partial [Podochytrium sp. JEL0797]
QQQQASFDLSASELDDLMFQSWLTTTAPTPTTTAPPPAPTAPPCTEILQDFLFTDAEQHVSRRSSFDSISPDLFVHHFGDLNFESPSLMDSLLQPPSPNMTGMAGTGERFDTFQQVPLQNQSLKVPRLSLDMSFFNKSAQQTQLQPTYLGGPRLSLDMTSLRSAPLQTHSHFSTSTLTIPSPSRSAFNSPTTPSTKLSLLSILSPLSLKSPRKKLSKPKLATMTTTTNQSTPSSPTIPTALDTRPRDHECDVCLTRFLRHQDLFRHKVRHSQKKEFECFYGCGASFSRSDAVTRHCKKKSCRGAPAASE